MFLRFEYLEILYFIIPALLLAIIYRLKFYKAPVYTYPLSSLLQNQTGLNQTGLKQTGLKKTSSFKWLIALRIFTLTALALLVARPQWVDPRTKINVNGINIIIALDISGSMQLFDDLKDQRSRIEIAKEEAIRFIENRVNDPIGIVLFGGDVISRCPLTLDKNILKDIVGNLKIGFINSDSTLLGRGLATSISRLKDSKAKNKVIVLLTDGIPSPDEISPDVAIEIAKKFGIKVYTIGVGGNQGYTKDPFGRVISVDASIDMKLLGKIAHSTGGKSFRARNSKEMRDIYNTINRLEKTNIETNIFNNYHEAYEFLLWVILLALVIEILLKLFRYRGLSC